MRSASKAVIQNIGIGTTGFLESVRQKWQATECAVVVNSLSQIFYEAVVPNHDGLTKLKNFGRHWPEDVAQQLALDGLLITKHLMLGMVGQNMHDFRTSCGPCSPKRGLEQAAIGQPILHMSTHAIRGIRGSVSNPGFR